MASLILNTKDIFRAERLFSERVCSPISTNSFFKTESDLCGNDREPVIFNKSISRLLKDAMKYRVVNL